MLVTKRSGNAVPFDRVRIQTAIRKSMAEVLHPKDEYLPEKVAFAVESFIRDSATERVTVEEIQSMVIDELGERAPEVGKAYEAYKKQRDATRTERMLLGGMLSEEFLSRYKHLPNPMDELGNFVYYRTYSRWLPEERRREYWWETVRRAVEYNCGLAPVGADEAELLFDNIFNLRQFPSGRTLWVGNTEVTKRFNLSNYNCSFTVINSLKDLTEVFYLLMVGAGAGIRVLPQDVAGIPKTRTDIKMKCLEYHPVLKDMRIEHSELTVEDNNTLRITVGDSKEAWVTALEMFFEIVTDHKYSRITNLELDFSHVRPKGEKLKTFGGTASGHESLQNMFQKIMKVIVAGNKHLKRKLHPIDVADIANIIGENVVVGGVRRTSLIVLFDPNDKAILHSKDSLYHEVDGVWTLNKDLSHRAMSNNSMYFTEKPTKEQIADLLESIKLNGEPGWVNATAAMLRRSDFAGVNPCGEILMDSKGLCNLTTLNVMAFVNKGEFDLERALIAQRLSVRMGTRMNTAELEMYAWDVVQKRDVLLGCSLTGWQDMVNATGMDVATQRKVLRILRDTARRHAEEYAASIGLNTPKLITTVKPEGTLSQLPCVSSGIHYQHSEYFLRRVRINAHDKLVNVLRELEYPLYPEVGQEENPKTLVVEFPQKAPKGRTKYEVTAIEQLENYKMFMQEYVEHNVSITVHVRAHEWSQVSEWLYKNWDSVVAVTFIQLDDGFYPLMPYESITEEEYHQRKASMAPFVPSLIAKYELEDEIDAGVSECAGGCPLR